MERMNVLIVCESSGTVRDAFLARGHNAWSCDLLPDDNGSMRHWEADYREVLGTCGQWDLVIGHPPCTHLCVAGNRWHAGTQARANAVDFVRAMSHRFNRVAKAWCIENPVGVLSTQWRKPDQYVQPWQFGHGETKKTGLWLHNLDPLVPTDVVEGREQRVWKMGPSPERWKVRSKTYAGIAKAMAEQWG